MDKKELYTVLRVSEEIGKHDSRMERCRKHDARTIVFITLCAVLCNMKTWDEIEEFGKCKKDLLCDYLGPLISTPSSDTYRRFFSILDPEFFEGEYRKWISMVFLRKEKGDGKRDVIAVDGKEICGASEKDAPVRVLSAFSTNYGISLGQKDVGKKTNEIPVMQELVGEIDVKDCIVTADALNCQKKTCEAVLKAKGDYFLFVKGNQSSLLEHIVDAVAGERRHHRNNACKASSLDESHCRSITRECLVIGEPLYLGDLSKEWPGVRSFGAITSENINNGREETRYFISSLKADADVMLDTARRHWGIENGLHWRLDVDFDEDKTRKKKNGAKNFSLICKMAMAILSLDKTKIPMSRKKTRMALSDSYFKDMLEKASAVIK